MSIVGAYMTMLEPKYVVAALVLNMFSTFIVLSLINPYRVDASEENIQMSNLHEGQSFFEMLGEYILAGFKVAIIVAAMLIGFIALIAALMQAPPVLLLDDVLSELDSARQEFVLNRIGGGQTLVSCCEAASVERMTGGRVLYMDKGRVNEACTSI